jgi:hypothetical protein
MIFQKIVLHPDVPISCDNVSVELPAFDEIVIFFVLVPFLFNAQS